MTLGTIRPAIPRDARAIVDIYNHYILHTPVTFEEEALDAAAMQSRIRSVAERHAWLVHEEAGRVLGYAYAAPFHARSAYRFAAESTIYLHPDATGRGIGRPLYTALLERLQTLGLHRVLGLIALPNAASVVLHEGLGFRKVAHLSEVGFKLGRWIDVGWWLRPLPGPPPCLANERRGRDPTFHRSREPGERPRVSGPAGSPSARPGSARSRSRG